MAGQRNAAVLPSQRATGNVQSGLEAPGAHFSTHVMNCHPSPSASGDLENDRMDVDGSPPPIEPPEGPILTVRI